MNFLAHGVGGGEDLPIPFEYALAGACAALAISFSVLALAWRKAKFEQPKERPAPQWLAALVDNPWFRSLLRLLGFAFFCYVGAAAVFGRDVQFNVVFGVFFVLLWVGIVPASLAFGSFYKAVSPVRAINSALAKVAGSDVEHGLRDYPARLGMWPAALGLFAFTWFELVYPFSNELGPVRLWIGIYVAVMLVGGAIYGNKFYENADPFEVFSTLVGRLSIWGRDEEDRLVLRSPLANLATTPQTAGLVAVCSVLLGSTAFDSFRGSRLWVTFVLDHPGISENLLNLGGLIGLILLAGVLFVVASMLTGVERPEHRWTLPAAFAHSLVPIIAGYFFAHYLSYFVEYGQTTLLQLNDPFANGSDLFGLANRSTNYWLSEHPTTLATLKVLGVVVGHVVAVVAAHDRAVALLPKRHQLTGQLSMLLVMVAFTVGGLTLLFSA
ncbi:hypothetical protein ACLM5J_07105 [Nocardioides sp. Bht2]|uniref:hypothetical protein n=1 Tax=Nocardioides sp. Bht2 TaxID=3392297 RepID=UPI0039B4D325